ncbi:hypothetical protein [Novosphingobium guangzhouense]|uniref:hypothetical protein n=1 Tax=Novosphingobium guangzhouense TaxID=1850347 RepID=UPI0011AF3DD9|nr:hypothetical protein [Novosphingobium guangzhouense]
MSRDRIHAIYCRCPQCAPRHPSAADISPVLRIALLTTAIGIGLAAVAWLGAAVIASLSSWS